MTAPCERDHLGRRVKGSASLVIIGATLLQAVVTVCVGFIAAEREISWATISVGVACTALWVRSWFLGVWVSPTEVRVRSWFRTYRVPVSLIRRAESMPYDGVVGVGIRYVPFIGSVHVVSLVMRGGERLTFPSTVNRNRTIRAVNARIRFSVGALAGRDA